MSGRVAAAAIGGSLAVHWLVPDRAIGFAASFAVHLLATACWIWLVRELVTNRFRPGLAESLVIVATLRLVLLPLVPAFSDDVYRYLFEGRMVLAGISPYLHAPDSTAAAPLRDAAWELINNPTIPAAYPPAVQLVNAAGASIGAGLFGVKLGFALLDVLAFWMLWRVLPAVGVASQRALIYGACPLVVLEFAGEGHGDSLTIAGLVGAWLAATQRRPFLAGAALGVAVLGKWMPLVFLPFLCRAVGDVRRTLFGFGIVVVACFVPFLWLGFSLDGTEQYVVRWRGNDSAFGVVFAVVDWVRTGGWFGDFEAQRVAKFPIAVLGVLVLAHAWRVRAPLERTLGWFFVFFVAFAPTVHPWYVTYLVPFLAVRANPGLLAFTGTAFLAYHVLPEWHLERDWNESGWIVALEYLPFYAAYCFSGTSLRRNAQIAARSTSGR
ncbi:MAG: DUF2029 domain-containing protein [Planctomycetes bacterium]|nr:DUF2029 domain-containing protein [Planctomycetota bacterium]